MMANICLILYLVAFVFIVISAQIEDDNDLDQALSSTVEANTLQFNKTIRRRLRNTSNNHSNEVKITSDDKYEVKQQNHTVTNTHVGINRTKEVGNSMVNKLQNDTEINISLVEIKPVYFKPNGTITNSTLVNLNRTIPIHLISEGSSSNRSSSHHSFNHSTTIPSTLHVPSRLNASTSHSTHSVSHSSTLPPFTISSRLNTTSQTLTQSHVTGSAIGSSTIPSSTSTFFHPNLTFQALTSRSSSTISSPMTTFLRSHSSTELSLTTSPIYKTSQTALSRINHSSSAYSSRVTTNAHLTNPSSHSYSLSRTINDSFSSNNSPNVSQIKHYTTLIPPHRLLMSAFYTETPLKTSTSATYIKKPSTSAEKTSLPENFTTAKPLENISRNSTANPKLEMQNPTTTQPLTSIRDPTLRPIENLIQTLKTIKPTLTDLTTRILRNLTSLAPKLTIKSSQAAKLERTTKSTLTVLNVSNPIETMLNNSDSTNLQLQTPSIFENAQFEEVLRLLQGTSNLIDGLKTVENASAKAVQIDLDKANKIPMLQLLVDRLDGQNLTGNALEKSLYKAIIQGYNGTTQDFRNMEPPETTATFIQGLGYTNRLSNEAGSTPSSATNTKFSFLNFTHKRVFFHTTSALDRLTTPTTKLEFQTNASFHSHKSHQNPFLKDFEQLERDSGYDDQEVTYRKNVFETSTFKLEDFRDHKAKKVKATFKMHPKNGDKLMQPYNIEKNSEFQMVVLIVGYKDRDIVNSCTGTLLSATWILTAANCINPNLTTYVRSPDCTEDNICYEEGVREIYFHSDFVEITDDETDMKLSCNNLALLSLAKPWRVEIEFALLPQFHHRTDFQFVFSACTSINYDGYLFWKSDVDNIFSPEQQNIFSNLTKLNVEVVEWARYCSYVGYCENIECRTDWNYAYTMSTSMESGVCGADTGSPLFCKRNDHYLLMGVRSSTTGCKLGFRFAANSYTRVDAYLQWIYQITEKIAVPRSSGYY